MESNNIIITGIATTIGAILGTNWFVATSVPELKTSPLEEVKVEELTTKANDNESESERKKT